MPYNVALLKSEMNCNIVNVVYDLLYVCIGEEYSATYVLSKAEKRWRRESREYVGRWRKNQVTMAVAAKLRETFLLLLDDRQLAVGSG